MSVEFLHHQLLPALNRILTGEFILFVLFTLIVLWSIRTHIYLAFFSPLRSVSSPPSWPILHHMPYYLNTNRNDPGDMYDDLMTKYGKNGRLRTYINIGSESFVTCNIDDIKTVLITQSHKFKKEETLSKLVPLSDNGLFLSAGKFHSWQRKLLTPAFSLSNVQTFTPTFTKHAQRLTKHWLKTVQRKKEDCKTVLVEEDLTKFGSDVVCETVFGLQANTLSEGKNHFVESLGTYFKAKGSLFGYLIQVFAPFLWKCPVGYFRTVDIAETTLRETVDKIILKKGSHNVADANGDVKEKPDLLDIMMKLKDDNSNEGLSDKVLRANVFTFLVAGIETTSISLTWSLYLLANHPDKQQHARDEAVAVLSSKSSISWDEIQKLDYIAAVIKESLRLYPPGPLITKMTAEDVSFGDIVLPKGHVIHLHISRVQKSEVFWENPMEFIPERHLNKDGEKEWVNNLVYLPFSAGPQGCIGRRLAMVQMKLTLAFLLRTFAFSISKDHPTVGKRTAFVQKPSPSPRLILTPLQPTSDLTDPADSKTAYLH